MLLAGEVGTDWIRDGSVVMRDPGNLTALNPPSRNGAQIGTIFWDIGSFTPPAHYAAPKCSNTLKQNGLVIFLRRLDVRFGFNFVTSTDIL